jgi:hypothetical protein
MSRLIEPLAPSVIPAKAGIQSHRRDVGDCGPWMPAFAGMTIFIALQPIQFETITL